MAAKNYQIIYGGRMMIERIVNRWIRRKTKNLTRIPLFMMTFKGNYGILHIVTADELK